MKRLIYLLLAGGAAILTLNFWYRGALRPADTADLSRIPFAVESGASLTTVSEELEAKGLIRSPRAFRFYVKRRGLDRSLQAGQFVLWPAMSVAEIVDTLHSGESQEVSLTIPEGFTVIDIDALLVRRGLSGTGEFLRCAQECDLTEFDFLPNIGGLASRGGRVEGYFFPDTYFVAPAEFTSQAFLNRLLATFEERVVSNGADDIRKSGRTLHEIVTMASLVEAEAGSDDERALIAGILWKRFDDGRGLGVDATVRYILDKPTDAITTADLNTDDQYNTRKFRGLPPGPIANPGLKSIQATVNPEASSYWYYLHGADGKIRYAETNEQHNLNRMKYL